MEGGSVRVRQATPDDTDAIVAVTAAGWRTAYRDIVAQDGVVPGGIVPFRHTIFLWQSLLSVALSGGTDEWLSERLGIPVTAVKSRWIRIQQRTATRLPQLLQEVPMGHARVRGVQTRHIILDYVRRTPSELTPYDRDCEP